MSIKFMKGDIFKARAQVIVNPVNCVGVMGSGLAKAFKDRNPKMFSSYYRCCKKNNFKPGQLHFWRHSTPQILNFPTKDNWKNDSEMEYITLGLQKFAKTYKALGIKSIAFPKLGCGKGGLAWNDVKLEMIRILEDLDGIEIIIYG